MRDPTSPPLIKGRVGRGIFKGDLEKMQFVGAEDRFQAIGDA